MKSALQNQSEAGFLICRLISRKRVDTSVPLYFQESMTCIASSIADASFPSRKCNATKKSQSISNIPPKRQNGLRFASKSVFAYIGYPPAIRAFLHDPYKGSKFPVKRNSPELIQLPYLIKALFRLWHSESADSGSVHHFRGHCCKSPKYPQSADRPAMS